MKNNKGFTVVELLASFSLTMVIVVFLFEILIEIKNLYSEANTKTEVIQKQAVLINKIRNTFDTKELSGVICSKSECVFNFYDYSQTVLSINPESNTIVYDNSKNLEEEKEKLLKEKDNLELSIARREKLLSNEKYVIRAPKEIVDKERECLEKEKNMLEIVLKKFTNM